MQNLNILVVSSSLNPKSRSRALAKKFVSNVESKEGLSLTLVDLQDTVLPLCDGGSVYELPEVAQTKALVESADAIIFASPIYVYGVNAAMKNFAELFGHSMVGKTAGFVCAAGGAMSYMSVMGFANSLMLDFRMIVLPRFVYVSSQDWDGDALSEKMAERLTQFGEEFLDLSKKIKA
ncbi:NAD(P)H-dependent oxidoreductase [Puniceicoccaceae bacterium K14]|nr:NAD(P)H-dependent oxidoreductase [Puniceicoccaceae bacterium K14]